MEKIYFMMMLMLKEFVYDFHNYDAADDEK